MTKRCKHEFETKDGYSDDILCQKCQTIWTITDYVKWIPTQLRTLPRPVLSEVLRWQAEKFAKDNPNYYNEVESDIEL